MIYKDWIIRTEWDIIYRLTGVKPFRLRLGKSEAATNKNRTQNPPQSPAHHCVKEGVCTTCVKPV